MPRGPRLNKQCGRNMLTVTQFREMTAMADDPPSDATITIALNRYIALIEGFIGRSFALTSYSETYSVGTGHIVLNTHPVTQVTSINGSADLTPYAIRKSSGIIDHKGLLTGTEVTVAYTGGYVDAPYELKVVLSTLTQAFLAGTHGGTGALETGRKEVVFGVSSVDTGSSAQQFEPYGDLYAELGPYVSVLEKYREPALA